MNHAKLNFAAEAPASGTIYTLNCTNNSYSDWVFYIYQTVPDQPSEVFSLAWFASPYKISVGSRVSFQWTVDYCFVWAKTGTLEPGVIFNTGGLEPCSLDGPNMTNFSVINGEGQLSTPTTGGKAGTLIIRDAPYLPNDLFSTGFGMSGYGTLVTQAYAGTIEVYIPTPNYAIAAAAEMQMGVVLAQPVSQATAFEFPVDVYTLNASFQPDNTWKISY